MGRPRPTPPAIAAGCQHAEAFNLMRYRTQDGLLTEVLWNSRDGVTPFGIRSADGREMRHVDWHRDQYEPMFRPVPGQRIFVTMSRETAEAFARRRIETYWDDPEYPIARQFDSKEQAVAALTESYWHEGHAPHVVAVKPDGTWGD